EVGRTGVAIDSIADLEVLFGDIPLAEVSTSMTINAPAALLLLLYELVAEEQGVTGERLRGTVQNDILKEYIARGNYIFPPRPSMRLTTDLFAYCAERMPSWNTISISGYHIREAGSTAVQELAFTLANGIAYCQAAVDAGLSPDEFGERLSFFFNAHNHFFQEVAKFRAARRLWARIMRERFGAENPKAQALRFHAQTGGSTLTAQQPENNIARVTVQALSAICGGAQSIHTNGFDEALALPTENSVRIALRTQQILAHEAGGTDTADPLGGSYFIEELTSELEQRARELIERVDERGRARAGARHRARRGKPAAADARSTPGALHRRGDLQCAPRRVRNLRLSAHLGSTNADRGSCSSGCPWTPRGGLDDRLAASAAGQDCARKCRHPLADRLRSVRRRADRGETPRPRAGRSLPLRSAQPQARGD